MSEVSYKNLKLVLFIDAILCGILGIGLLFFWESFFQLIDWPFYDPLYGHILGATFITYSILNFIASRQTIWVKMEKIVLANIIYDGIGAAIMISDFYLYDLPVFIWTSIGVLIGFLIIYLYYYIPEIKVNED